MQNQPSRAGDSISKILHESNSDVFAKARQAIMEKVLLATVQEAIDALGSPDAIAQQALAYVDEKHSVLNKAQEALQARLVQDVADRATEALEATEEVVQQARPLVNKQPLVAAVDALKAQLVEEIAKQTTRTLADTDAMVEEAAAYLNEEHEALLQAVDVLKGQILRAITNDSLAQISSEISEALDKTAALQASNKAPADQSSTMASVPLPKATPPGSQRQQKRVANGYPMIEETIVEAKTNALPDGLANTGYYVYSILANASASTLDPATLEGLDAGYPLEAISFNDVTALVSEVPLGSFGIDAEDETWQDKSKRIHNAICEQVDDACAAILPMPSSITYASKEKLEAALRKHHDDLSEALQQVTGRQEWSVKIYCDVVKIWEAMLGDEKETHAFLL